jgi:hypothetical protein
MSVAACTTRSTTAVTWIGWLDVRPLLSLCDESDTTMFYQQIGTIRLAMLQSLKCLLGARAALLFPVCFAAGWVFGEYVVWR